MTEAEKRTGSGLGSVLSEDTKLWLKELTELPGAPGFEEPIRLAMKRKLKGLPVTWHQDRLGGAYAEWLTENHVALQQRDNEKPTVLVCGHMDEVGFMITQCLPTGMLKFQPLGGWSPVVLPAQRLQIITDQGPVTGVIASTPPHLLNESAKDRTPPIDQMVLDVGASTADELSALGIRPGLSAVPYSPFTELNAGKRWLAKAWDNRYGVGLAMETMAAFANDPLVAELPFRLICGATVQEEVGLRGAEAAARLFNPDVCFVLDASPANDSFGGQQAVGQLGGGVLIRLMDRTMITSPRMVRWIMETAEQHQIRYQFYTSPGGTDAGAIHQSGIGVPTAVIGICARYIHSASSIIDPSDYAAARTLLYALIRSMTPDRIRWLQGEDAEEQG